MRFYWSPFDHSGLRFAPALLGLVLILIGLALISWEWLLRYAVASVFLVAGLSLLLSAWRLRRNVTYRRMDDSEGYSPVRLFGY